MTRDESLVNALIPYNAMKLYALKRFDLKGFEIFKNIYSNCRFRFFLKDIGYIYY